MGANLQVRARDIVVSIHTAVGVFIGALGVFLYFFAERLRVADYHLWTDLFYPIKSSVLLGTGLIIGSFFLIVAIARRFEYMKLYVMLVLIEIVIFPIGTILGVFSLWKNQNYV